MAVLAEFSFEVPWDAHIVSHPDLPGKIHVSGGTGEIMRKSLLFCKSEENIYSFLCYVHHLFGPSSASSRGH